MEYLLKTSVIILLFYICYKLFLQRETFFRSNRWYLLTGLLIAIFIPFIVIPIYIEQSSTGFNDFVISNEVTNAINSSNSSFNIHQFILLSYFIGVIFFLGKLIIEFSSLVLILKNNKRFKKDQYTLIETTEDITPFSFFNRIVYNPNMFDSAELDQIIAHEKAHAKEFHSIDILVTHLTTILLWFNPLIWLYKKDIQQNLEFIADQSAQTKSHSQKSYQRLLLKTSLPSHQLALTNNFYNSLIKKRIVMLQKTKSNKLKSWKYALILPLLGLFLMSFNTKEVYLENNTDKQKLEFINQGDVEVAIISKDFSDADFKKLQKEFATKGVTLKFKGIKRNSKGEIIAIKIDASTKKSNASFNLSSDDPIKPIKITYNSDDHSISIGNATDLHFENAKGHKFVTKEGSHKIHKSGDGNNVFIISEDDDHEGHEGHEDKEHNIEIIIKDKDGNIHKSGNVHKDKQVYKIKSGTKTRIISEHDNDIELEMDSDKDVIFIKEDKDGKKIEKRIIIKKGDKTTEWIENEDGENEWTEDDGKVIKLRTLGKGKNKMFFTGDGENDPLFIIDGKEATKKQMEDLDSDSIETIEVIKGDKVVEEHGEKAKGGVVIIKTKK